jgi:phospholipase/lecithinase/hemolysin
VKLAIRFALPILLFVTGAFQAQAGFSSLYVFGDALSATADNPAPAPTSDYYQKHDSNGRIWIEVLAQRQGLTYDASKNNSYYDHNSAATVTDVKNFTITQANATNALFIVWVCNSDTFDAAQVPDTASQWIAANKRSQTNHLQIITNLYSKGVRTLIMPNAVDISEIPSFNISTSLTNVMHNGCVDYNTRFSNTLNQARALCPGLKIYAPDFFTLLNNVLTNAASYGLTNVLKSGLSIDALDALYKSSSAVLNGPGTNYIFWDPQDPTAKFHEVIADNVQQLVSPAQITKLTVLNGSNKLDVANIPIGLNGFVDGSTNLLLSWTSVQGFNSTNVTQSIFVPSPQLTFLPGGSGGIGGSINPGSPPGTGPTIPVYYEAQFYRLRFPYAWTWP